MRTNDMFESYADERILFAYAFDCCFMYGGFSLAIADDGRVLYEPFRTSLSRCLARSGPKLEAKDVERLTRTMDEIVPDVVGFEGRLLNPVMDGGTNVFAVRFGDKTVEFAQENVVRTNPDEAISSGRNKPEEREELIRQNRLLDLFEAVAGILEPYGVILKLTTLEVPCRDVVEFALTTEPNPEETTQKKGESQTIRVGRNGAAELTIRMADGNVVEMERELKEKKTEDAFEALKILLNGLDLVPTKAVAEKIVERTKSLPEPNGTWLLETTYADGTDETRSGECMREEDLRRTFSAALRKATGFGKTLYATSC